MGSASYDSVIEEVKRRLNITDLIQNYVSLRKSGKDYIGLCPFHDDKNPSMHVSEEKGLFHCFSCGAGGDIFGFMMKYNNISFRESLSELAKLADIEIKLNDYSPRSTSHKNTYYKLNKLVCNYFQRNLFQSKKAQKARNYLKNRGINSETAKLFNLGYAFDEWNTLTEYLEQKKVPISVAEELGLISGKKGTGGYYDRFRDRIIFPIFDVTGNVIGFGGRVLNDDNTPKYYNSPESEIYKKRNSFYGLNINSSNIRKSNSAVLVEGYFDLISLSAHGADNVVATLGTSFTSEHARILKRYTDNVVILFDGDESGLNSSIKAGEVMLESGIMPRIATLPEGTDPDTFINRNGKNEFDKLINNSTLLPDYNIEKIFSEFRDDNLSRERSARRLMDFISRMQSAVDRSFYISKIAGMFGFRENDLYSMIKQSSGANTSSMNSSGTDKNRNEFMVLKIILKFPDMVDEFYEKGGIDLIDDKDIKSILDEVKRYDYQNLTQLVGLFDNSSVQDLISEAVFSSDQIADSKTANKVLKHCRARLKLKKINKELLILRKRIEETSRQNDYAAEKELLKNYKDLVEKEKIVRGELNES